jgi:hypothetical protein
MPAVGDLYFGAYSGSAKAAATSSVQLLAADVNRKGLIVFNDSPNILFLKFGAAAKTNDYTLQVAPATKYESPWPLVPQGVISGVWGAASGSAYVTEIT